MFPFATFLASFSPFFLRKKRHELSLGRSMGYYFSIWGILILVLVLISTVLSWIFITPERVRGWSENIPAFAVTIQDGILTETGLPTDPFIPVDEQDFIIFISQTLSETPADKERKGGIYILKDRIRIVQSEVVGEKEQEIRYADEAELKNITFNKILLSEKILSELPTIQRAGGILLVFITLFASIFLAMWYCVWSFFWGLIIWLISRAKKDPLTYEHAVGFVLSVFFPVSLLSTLLMLLGVWFPFSMTLLFLIFFGYNHLSFYKEHLQE